MKRRKLGVPALAVSELARHPVRTAALVFVAAVLAFAVFAGTIVASGLKAGVDSLAARMGADIIVVPQGTAQKARGVLLRAEPSDFRFDGSVLDAVRRAPGVAKASGQLFLASLDAQCCSVKVQMIGIDQESDFAVGPWLASALKRPLADGEILAGDFIFAEPGDTLRFFDRPFRVAGKLEATGFGFDSSVFVTLETARELLRQKGTAGADSALSAVLVKIEPGRSPLEVTDAILDQVGLRAGVNFVYATNMMSSTAERLQQVVRVIGASAAGLWAAALAVLFAVYFFAGTQRAPEFGTLRALGAPRGFVAKLVSAEALLTGAAGTLLGAGAAAFLLGRLGHGFASALGLPFLTSDGSVWGLALMLSAAAGILTAVLAALPNAWRFGRAEIYAEMKEHA